MSEFPSMNFPKRKTDTHDLGLLIDSKIPLIVIESHEENRVLDMITTLATRRNLPCISWTITEGAVKRPVFDGIRTGRVKLDKENSSNNSEADNILQRIKQARGGGIYILCDFHPFLVNEPARIRMIKDIALRYSYLKQTVIFVSHSFPIPQEIRHFTARFEIALPSREQIADLIKKESAQWARKNNGTKIKSNVNTFNLIVNNLKGVTTSEAERLIKGAISDGALTQSDIPELNKAKFKLMDMDGILSYEHDIPGFHEVGGLNNLKKWLKKRTIAFQAPRNQHIDSPKGILLTGVQGGGKSLAAKAVAANWHLPLLRLDFGALYNKYFGETEKNLRESLKLADTMAPCVLWMDEIEKGVSTDDSDQGVSKRLLSTLLTWMAERKSPVFIVATSNNIKRLPPELIRKGRLDEIFFVDLPDQEIREKIFSIHLTKREINPERFSIENLAREAEGFSGAEIEQSIVSALYSNNGSMENMTEEHILTEINNTSPISVVMAEEIYQLRSWARNRTVPAN